MIARLIGRAGVALTQLANRMGEHVYLSTAHLHGDPAYCGSKEGKAGAKRPAECKFCGAPCIGSHPQEVPHVAA